MKHLIQSFSALVLLFALPATSNATAVVQSIPTVDHVDLDSYLGLWHEVSRIENDFQDNEPSPGEGPCYNSTAEYSRLPKGKIKVQNACQRQSGAEVAIAKARVVRGSNNAKLKVNFTGVPLLEWLGIGDGDYWVLALGEKNSDNLYSWVLVGAPKLDYGWVLSRTPTLPEAQYDAVLEYAESLGYDRESFKSFQR